MPVFYPMRTPTSTPLYLRQGVYPVHSNHHCKLTRVCGAFSHLAKQHFLTVFRQPTQMYLSPSWIVSWHHEYTLRISRLLENIQALLSEAHQGHNQSALNGDITVQTLRTARGASRGSGFPPLTHRAYCCLGRRRNIHSKSRKIISKSSVATENEKTPSRFVFRESGW
jgi:hypothetical protein